jgi:hypothetical protein
MKIDTAAKAKRHLLGVEIPRDELAFRLMQAAIGTKPPPGTTAAEAMRDAEAFDPGMAESFRRQAEAAAVYFAECINAAKAVN